MEKKSPCISHLGLQRFFDTVYDIHYDYAEFYCCVINSQWVTFREFVRRIDILFMLMLV